MKTVEVKTFMYEELSDEAKAKARDWYRADMSMDQEFAWDSVRQDADNIGLKIVSLSDNKSNKGAFEDGAFNCANKILSEHGESCETYKTAKKFLDEWSALPDTDDEESRVDDADALEGEFLHALLEDYRIMYDKEIEYRESDEAVEETIIANEYPFTEDGNRFKY